MGKSTAAEILRQRKIAVVDTDDLARQIVQPGQSALAEICQAFGVHLLDAAGQLNRAALAALVFGDAHARGKLEAILHPRITEIWRQQLCDWRKTGQPLGVVVIPLLFETKAEAEFDAVICLACSEPTQRQRLVARDWSVAQIQQRLAAQMPISEKMLRSQFVVWTEGDIELTAQQLARIFPV